MEIFVALVMIYILYRFFSPFEKAKPAKDGKRRDEAIDDLQKNLQKLKEHRARADAYSEKLDDDPERAARTLSKWINQR